MIYFVTVEYLGRVLRGGGRDKWVVDRGKEIPLKDFEKNRYQGAVTSQPRISWKWERWKREVGIVCVIGKMAARKVAPRQEE